MAAVALGNLGDDDVALLDFTIDDFVDLIHVVSSSNILTVAWPTTMRALLSNIFLNYTMLLEERRLTEHIARCMSVSDTKKNGKSVLLFF